MSHLSALDVARLVTAETVSYDCFLESMISIPDHKAMKGMRKTIEYWRYYLLELIPHMDPNARPPFKKLCDDLQDLLQKGESVSASASSRSKTKKLKQHGGMPRGFGFGKKAAPPKPSGHELALRGKSMALIRKAGKAVTRRLDLVRFEEATLNQIRRYERLQLRLMAAGKHTQAAFIQTTIDGMRDDIQLFPGLSPILIFSVIAYLIYQSPQMFYALIVSVFSIGTGVPLAATAAAGGGALQGAKNLFMTSNVSAYDAAVSAANTTGTTVAGITSAVVSASTPEEAARLGYLFGGVIFVPLILIASLKYNSMVGDERRKAREGRIRGLAAIEAELSKLGNSVGVSGIPLLMNQVAAADPAVQQRISNKMAEIYTHFKFTEEEQQLPKDKQIALLKRRYHERLLSNHPNKGGKAENLQKTRNLYKEAQNIVLAQANNEEENAVVGED
jgi:hypothetical protein